MTVHLDRREPPVITNTQIPNYNPFDVKHNEFPLWYNAEYKHAQGHNLIASPAITAPIAPIAHCTPAQHISTDSQYNQHIWIRFDKNAATYKTTFARGPPWTTVTRRTTVDAETGEVIEDINPQTCKHPHDDIPNGPRNINTIFYYSTPVALQLQTPQTSATLMGK